MGGAVVGGDEVGITMRFWIKFRKESTFVLYSPFVVCLAAGVLDPEPFLHCISQDIPLLKAFAQAYELAEECADDDEDKAAIYKLRKRALKKLKNHDADVRDWGFELPEERKINEVTVKYTDFMVATASGKVEGEKALGKLATPFEKTKLAAYTFSAMAPCLRFYAFITKEIQALLDPIESDHIYKKWIESISSQKFEASTLQMEDLMDKLSVSLTGEELEVMEKLYHQAMKLESDFFSAQPVVQPTVVPFYQIHGSSEHKFTIFSDFDITCTAVDSSALLAEIAIITYRKADMDTSEGQLARMSSADLQSTWGVISSQYTDEYEKCMESILSSERVEGFNYEGLCEALKQLSDFEKEANSRVVKSGVLKGLNMEDIKRAGEHLILQDGCSEFFQEIAKNENLKNNAHVLSYCWCDDLIKSVFSSGDQSTLNVHSNELAYEESITTGEITRKMESPMDKLQVFKDILNCGGDDGNQRSCYIGGSVGDVLCLLEADVGIVFDSCSSIRKLGDHFGISFIPLFSGVVKKQRELTEVGALNWQARSGVLYTVSCWAEIHAFVLGS